MTSLFLCQLIKDGNGFLVSRPPLTPAKKALDRTLLTGDYVQCFPFLKKPQGANVNLAAYIFLGAKRKAAKDSYVGRYIMQKVQSYVK